MWPARGAFLLDIPQRYETEALKSPLCLSTSQQCPAVQVPRIVWRACQQRCATVKLTEGLKVRGPHHAEISHHRHIAFNMHCACRLFAAGYADRSVIRSVCRRHPRCPMQLDKFSIKKVLSVVPSILTVICSQILALASP